MVISPTPRAYTVRLSVHQEAAPAEALWNTHLTVNLGAQAWGEWLLTLRGGLSPELADGSAERRAILALSWFSVEAPDGTAARPTSPLSSCTSTSTVGLPRESRISRALMSEIVLMIQFCA